MKTIESSRQIAKTLYRYLHDGGCSERDFVYTLHYWKQSIRTEAIDACIEAIKAERPAEPIEGMDQYMTLGLEIAIEAIEELKKEKG